MMDLVINVQAFSSNNKYLLKFIYIKKKIENENV